MLVGTSAVGLRDLVATPLRPGLPGVMVHAEIIDQIVNSDSSPPGLGARAGNRRGGRRGAPRAAFLPWLSTSPTRVAAAALARSIAGGWFAFSSYSLLLSPILPALTRLLAYGAASGVRLLLTESESRYIRGAFSQIPLAGDGASDSSKIPGALVLGGENRELTLLFCDIRSFTRSRNRWSRPSSPSSSTIS